MSVPIFLFSGLTNYGTQTLSMILIAYLVLVSATSNISAFCRLSIPSLPVSRSVATVYRPTSIALSCSLKCCSHPMNTDRIVVDCFYFTQAITLSLLVCFNSYPSTLGGFTHSAPVNYHSDQRFI